MRNHDTLYVFVIVLPGKWLDFRVKRGTDTEAPCIFRLSLFQPLLAPLWLECNRFFCFCQCANSASERNLSACWFRLYLTGNTMSRGAHWSDSRCCLENCQRNFHILFLEPMYACPVLTHCKARQANNKLTQATVQCNILIGVSAFPRCLMWFLLGHVTPLAVPHSLSGPRSHLNTHLRDRAAEKFPSFCRCPHIYPHKQELWWGRNAKFSFL